MCAAAGLLPEQLKNLSCLVHLTDPVLIWIIQEIEPSVIITCMNRNV